jgi:hypothetical protein
MTDRQGNAALLNYPAEIPELRKGIVDVFCIIEEDRTVKSWHALLASDVKSDGRCGRAAIDKIEVVFGESPHHRFHQFRIGSGPRPHVIVHPGTEGHGGERSFNTRLYSATRHTDPDFSRAGG